MKQPLVIFGCGDFAEIAAMHFEHDSNYEVAAFAVDREYLSTPELAGRPVIATDMLLSRFPPAETSIFIAIGYSGMNKNRAAKYFEFKQLGYKLASYVSSRLASSWPVKHGEHCFILEANVIQPFVTIGDNCVLWSGNHTGHHCAIGDHCYITSHVVLSGRSRVGDYCFVGTNCTIGDHVTIAPNTLLGAGALVLSDTSEGQVLTGQTARVRKVDSESVKN